MAAPPSQYAPLTQEDEEPGEEEPPPGTNASQGGDVGLLALARVPLEGRTVLSHHLSWPPDRLFCIE
jgi:hypothetical protein